MMAIATVEAVAQNLFILVCFQCSIVCSQAIGAISCLRLMSICKSQAPAKSLNLRHLLCCLKRNPVEVNQPHASDLHQQQVRFLLIIIIIIKVKKSLNSLVVMKLKLRTGFLAQLSILEQQLSLSICRRWAVTGKVVFFCFVCCFFS